MSLRQGGFVTTRTALVNLESGPADDVDAGLAAAGADIVVRVSDAKLAGYRPTDLDALVVVARGIDRSSCATLNRLRDSLPESTIVLVVRTATGGSLLAAIRAGASAVVLRPAAKTAAGPALCAANAGQVCIPRELTAGAFHPVLTTREKQTLAMLVLGFSNAEIARKLHVTESTVKSHLSTAFAKLGVRSRSEAAAAILDPETGLGTGILRISAHEPREDGWTSERDRRPEDEPG